VSGVTVDSVRLPAASDAAACSVCAPFGQAAVFQLKLKGGVRDTANGAPSSRSSTRTTA
jgi:hypothetical protein